METKELERAVEGILFAAGEPVKIERMAAVLAVEPQEVESAGLAIADRLKSESRGVRIVKLDDMLQMCSAPEISDVIRQCLETRKPPKLSPSALEVLSIVAYFQPVTRAYIEEVRGVDSSYTVSVLTDRGLIEPCGHLDAPGRPTIFRTTPAFLRTFAISSLEELPALPETGESDDEQKLMSTITKLQEAEELSKTPEEAEPETPAEEGK